MKSIETILLETSHRPYPLPDGNWKYYQEWHDVLFAHWKVPVVALRKLVPGGLEIDLYEGEGWISLAVFTLKNLHPHNLPSFPPVSDFIELNLRTYVVRNNKPGIYFLSLEAQKTLSASMARIITGLSYSKSVMSHNPGCYESENLSPLSYLKAVYRTGESISEKRGPDRWLTDRFCLFRELSGDIYSQDFHHLDWPLKSIEVESLEVNYRFSDILIDYNADLYHFSEGVQVATWGKVKA